jgi:putative flippase GtrA
MVIRRELSIFVVVGCLTVALDFIVYKVMTYFYLCDISLAKAVSFIVGCIFAYFANRFWTFGQRITRSGSLWRFTLVYVVGLVANVFINQDILSSWDSPAALYVAFLVATGVSAALNFMGMKWFVFTRRTLSSSV